MALVGILTAIDAALYSLQDNFIRMGANTFEIEPKRDRVSGNRRGRKAKRADVITFNQAMEFKKRFDFPARVSVRVFGTSLATAKHGDEKTNPNVRFIGIDENFLDVKGYEIEYGRNLSMAEVSSGSNKVIIGMDIVNSLFDEKPEKAVNKVISVGNIKYKVVGILKSKGSSLNANEDRVIFGPLMNVKRYYGSQKRNYNISVAAFKPEDMEAAEAVTIGTFRNIRGLKASQENDFEIFKSDSFINILKENTVKFRWAAIAIGLITLLGAAIGLMNIMLVSVTERTREIGVRKSNRSNTYECHATVSDRSCRNLSVGRNNGHLAGYFDRKHRHFCNGRKFFNSLGLDVPGCYSLYDRWADFRIVSCVKSFSS